jgi:N-acetyl-anhydromuramyl-L-alanine amidase AmpD
MAKVLKDFKPSRKRGPEPRYPWDDWFDGQQWLLTRDEDFKSTLVIMQDTIRKKAKKLKKRVSVWYGDEDGTLVVQCTGSIEEKKATKRRKK